MKKREVIELYNKGKSFEFISISTGVDIKEINKILEEDAKNADNHKPNKPQTKE